MAISREAVVWGYRFFLGREPESEAMINLHLGVRDATHLAQVLARSPEFATRRRNLGLAASGMLEAAQLHVDSEATPAEIAACLRKIKAAWTHLGAVAPHFSVLTDSRFLPENLPEALTDFWTSGRQEAEAVLRTLARHGFALPGQTCVEYGCGVGRVTTGLSRKFQRVHAYDISAQHLDVARKRARELAVGNVSFHECSADVPGNVEPCDVFYSTMVFQHNPPPIIAEMIRNSLRALRPGGMAVFQVPSYISGYSFKLPEWLQADHPLEMQMHCLPQHRIFALVAEQSCVVLEVREDEAAGPRDRVVSNTFVVRKIQTGAGD